MRKLVESTFITLDGMIDDPHVWGSPYWDAEHNNYSARLLEPADALLLGRETYALELESTWSTGGKPPPTHWHPRQREHFEVLEGELTVVVGGDPARVLRTGETIEIPPRTAHRMWNAGAETARATWRVSPALRTEEMFRAAERGRSPLRALKMLWTFRNEYRLGRTRGR